MTLVYTLMIINFLLTIGLGVNTYKMRKFQSSTFRNEMKNLREDLDLVARNPAQARRKLKSR